MRLGPSGFQHLQIRGMQPVSQDAMSMYIANNATFMLKYWQYGNHFYQNISHPCADQKKATRHAGWLFYDC